MGRILYLRHTCQGKQGRRKCPGKVTWPNPSRMLPGYGPVAHALIFTFRKSPCELRSTKRGLKMSFVSNTGSGLYSKCNIYATNSLYIAFWTAGLLLSPSHSKVHVQQVQKEVGEPQDPKPSGRLVMATLYGHRGLAAACKKDFLYCCG